MPRILDIVIVVALVLWAFGSSSPQQPLDRPRNVVLIGYDPGFTGVFSNARYHPMREGTLHGEPPEGSQRLFQDLRKVHCEGHSGIFSRNFPRRCSFMIEEFASS